MNTVKTSEEVAAILEVQRAAEAGMAAVIGYLRTDTAPTSEGAHELLEATLQTFDCDSPEGHIIACGPASAEPHEKGVGPFLSGQPVVIDIYPRSRTSGFWADMSRTVCIGEPPQELQKMYDAVFNAQELALSLVRPGTRGQDVYEAVQNFFNQHGYKTSGVGKEFTYKEGFVHALGHGVGQEIHEGPKLGMGNDVLEAGQVLAIEPGLYYEHIGGVRLEDMVLVTQDGCTNLTNFPKRLTIET